MSDLATVRSLAAAKPAEWFSVVDLRRPVGPGLSELVEADMKQHAASFGDTLPIGHSRGSLMSATPRKGDFAGNHPLIQAQGEQLRAACGLTCAELCTQPTAALGAPDQ